MSEQMSADPETLQVNVQISPQPLKGERTLPPEAIKEQAARALRHLKKVDYSQIYGTCTDERPRVGLRSGEAKVEPRPSVLGGPAVHGLAVSELSGVFKGQHSTGRERMRHIIQILRTNGLQPGGHEHCAADDGLGSWLKLISAQNAEAIKGFARQSMGDAYSEDHMATVLENADSVNDEGTYAEWQEQILFEELGGEAGEAIETMAEVPHEAKTFLRTRLPGYTVDQTELHNDGGEDSFVYDDDYADTIENVLANGPETVRQLAVMRHAREAIIWAVAQAVPNPELHEIRFSA